MGYWEQLTGKTEDSTSCETTDTSSESIVLFAKIHRRTGEEGISGRRSSCTTKVSTNFISYVLVGGGVDWDEGFAITVLRRIGSIAQLASTSKGNAYQQVQ